MKQAHSVFLFTTRRKKKQKSFFNHADQMPPVSLLNTLRTVSNSFLFPPQKLQPSITPAARAVHPRFVPNARLVRHAGVNRLTHKVPKPNHFLLIWHLATWIMPCSRALCQPRAHWQDVQRLIISQYPQHSDPLILHAMSQFYFISPHFTLSNYKKVAMNNQLDSLALKDCTAFVKYLKCTKASIFVHTSHTSVQCTHKHKRSINVYFT